MAFKKVKFTPEGFKKIKDRFDFLTEKRKEAIVSLRTAREMGDLSENGAYKAARFQLSDIDRELRKLTLMIRLADIVEPHKSNGFVTFGSTVTLLKDDESVTYTLVSGYESNPAEGKVSEHSPIGRAINGKRIGDKITIHAPAGTIEYLITAIT